MEQQNHLNNSCECNHHHVHESECQEAENEKDIKNDWAKSSRFLSM